MKKNIILLTGIILFVFQNVIAQNQNEKKFEATGKPIVLIFADFYSDMYQGHSKSAFEVKRAYFGYDYIFAPEWTAQVKLDIGDPNSTSGLKRYAFFRNAQLKYSKGKINWNSGLLDLYHFKVQEDFWAHRYVYKSFQDENKMGTPGDIGTTVQYKFSEAMSLDAAFTNGEGFGNIQTDNSYKLGFGGTYKYKDFLTTRLYADVISKKELNSTICGFIGIKPLKKLAIGGEYNVKLNSGFKPDNNQFGLSVYGRYEISKKYEVFGRFDNLSSNIVPGDSLRWNRAGDGSTVIGGLQYKLNDKSRLAIDYIGKIPFISGSKTKSYLYLNLEVKL